MRIAAAILLLTFAALPSAAPAFADKKPVKARPAAKIAALPVAAPLLGSDEPIVSIAALKEVEKASDTRFLPDLNDPWEPLGDTRGIYLPGYGAVFTFEMSLVNVTPITPFHPTVTPAEIKAAHDRKIKKLPVLKTAMRELIAKAAVSLHTLPPTEQITFEAILANFSFEDRTGLPRRLTMTANRQKVLDAVARKATPAELATLIEEREE